MELIDTLSESGIRELNNSTANLRSMNNVYMTKNSNMKRTFHDGFHPFTAMSYHIIVPSSGEKKVVLTQTPFFLYIDRFPPGDWVIEKWMINDLLFYPTLEEAAGYCNEEEKRWN